MLIVSVHYLILYQPSQDPFRTFNQRSFPARIRPNPVDRIVLRWLRHVPKRILTTHHWNPIVRSRLEMISIKVYGRTIS